jgi:malate dehydrogenase (oxaloacetate-decarboxylating)
MDEAGVFPFEAADVACQAVKEGLAREDITHEEAYARAEKGIKESRELVKLMIDEGFIKTPPQSMLQTAFDWAVKEVR